MSDLNLKIDFDLNTPEATADAGKVRDAVKGVNDEATKGGKKANEVAKEQEGILERLRRRMAELRVEQEKANSTAKIEKYNVKIQEFQKEIDRLGKIGLQGFDDMGRAIPDFDRPKGKLERLNEAAKLYNRAIQEATNPEIITKYNRKLEETEKEIQRLRNAGKTGFDEIGNKVKENTGFLDKFKVTFLSIMSAFGLQWGLDQLIQFGKELFTVAKEAEGIEIAFSRLANSKQVLEDLKIATRGQVSELLLMQTAVKASDFKIPMDVLAKGLAFAGQKASDTGKDVDYLVNSFVDGLGRKSLMILDNLNISQQEVQKEMKITGDFATAVGNVIDRQMSAAGTQVDTLASKTSRMGRFWDDAKTSVAGFFRALLNPDLADPKKIAQLTDQYSKSFSKFGTYTVDQQKEIIANTEKVVKGQAEIYKKAKADFDKNGGGQFQDLRLAQEGERLKALQNVLQNLKSQNAELALTERKKKGILSIEELNNELTDLKTKRDSELDRKEIAALNKQIADKQKLISQLDGSDTKEKSKNDERDENKRLAAQERQIAMQQKIGDLKDEYSRKSLTGEEAELQAVRDKFSKIAAEIKRFNADPKNQYKVDGSGLKALSEQAVNDLKYKQDTEKLKASLEQQKALYGSFENYKKQLGDTTAAERFKSEIDVTKDYLQALQAERAKLDEDKNNGGEQERKKFLDEQIKLEMSRRREVENQNFADAFEAAKSHSQKLLDIEIEYRRRVAALGENATAEQIVLLAQQRDAKIQSVNAEALQAETKWAEMFGSFEAMSKESVRKYLDEVRKRVNEERTLNKITQTEYLQLISEIDTALKNLTNNNSFAAVSGSIKKWRTDVEQFGKGSAQAKTSWKGLAGDVSDAAGDVNQIIGQVAQSLDKLGIGGEELQKTLGNVMGIVGGAGDIAKGLATGNPVDVVKGSIQLLTSAIDLFNTKDKKLQKQIDGYQRNLKELGKAYAQLERDINNSVGESYYSDSAKSIENLKKQQGELQKSIDAERSKKKADGGKIDEWQKQLDSIPNQIADINKAVSEMLVQTTFKDFSNQLADAFVDAFSAGEDAANKFDDVFNNVIQNAVKNSLKLKLIEPQVKLFTDSLTAYMQNNDNSVKGFDFDKWKAILKTAGQNMTNALEGFEDVFKDDLTGNARTAAGAIKGITADQADLLAGQFGGLRLAQLETNNINKALFAYMQKSGSDMMAVIKANHLTHLEIATNTKRTADNTEKLWAIDESLKSINKKMDSDSNALRAAGLNP